MKSLFLMMLTCQILLCLSLPKQSRYSSEIRKSQAKCNEYKVCKQVVEVDIRSEDNNDDNAREGEFPHMAAICWRYKNGRLMPLCAGSLISENFVLIAGHCTSLPLASYYESPEPKVARLGGAWNIREEDGSGDKVQDVPISAIVKHPEYTSASRNHDIALLKLERNVRFTDIVRPACLWQTFDIPNESAVATSFETVVSDADFQRAIHKMTLEIVAGDKCGRYLDEVARVANGTQICVGESRTEECRGNGGGSLQLADEERSCAHRIVGVASFGPSCGHGEISNVYTRVGAYLDWIESVVWA